ncbi:hypothetical protein B9L19_08375 [Geobacillus thermocatenulatus]|uniref:Uncharacterized protein n=1 Tax=Geobacillus thermocatenulatus TaxID=33938 RepID=A0AA91YVI1_9BACL|nr:hypothetical protein B9L19_08375 [Geobacillus thermocatenulatus]
MSLSSATGFTHFGVRVFSGCKQFETLMFTLCYGTSWYFTDCWVIEQHHFRTYPWIQEVVGCSVFCYALACLRQLGKVDNTL